MVLSNGVYIDTLNLMPRIQNQIRSLAAFDNPEFYKNKRLGYSNYYNFSAVYLGKDIDGYIQVPRGLREKIMEECEKAGISVDVSDQREKGHPIRVAFKGDLRTQQELAAEKLLSHSDGVLSAATAFGKTVVCSYLIAERKVNTLILLQSKDLLNQWVDELNKFLEIKEEPPEYETKTGRKKKRESAIGILHGSKNTLTGIIDVAMVGSMYSKGKFNELINSYGMVIMDECHHAASNTSMELLQKINAKYVYGVSATPKRGDSLDRIIYMLLGPLRHRFTALERTQEQGIGHYFVPRYSRIVDNVESKENINKAYSLISTSKVRNEMIVKDVIACVARKQTPVILTRFKEHAKLLYHTLKNEADHVFLLYGDNSDRENADIRVRLKQIPQNETLILVATGQKNAIFDSGNYTEKFEQDIVEAEKMVVISSPDIRQDKIERFLFLMKGRQEAGVKATVITTDPEEVVYGSSDVCHELIRMMRQVGINVVIKQEVEERFAIIDDELVWHGGMNLLGKVDVWDNLMRIKNHQVAAELMEIALGSELESQGDKYL